MIAPVERAESSGDLSTSRWMDDGNEMARARNRTARLRGAVRPPVVALDVQKLRYGRSARDLEHERLLHVLRYPLLAD